MIGFYNHFGFGDIFISREFVRQTCDYFGIPTKLATYYHNKNFKFFIDIPMQEEALISMLSTSKFIIKNDNITYINTWIGRDSKYVLPGVACTIKKYIEMYRDADILIPNDEWLYIPSINFEEIYRQRQNPFCGFNKHCVLVCNGDVLSGQSKNFDFAPIIEKLARNHKDRTFILTKKTGIKLENVLHTDDFTGGIGDLFDIAWLSENVCDVIIGRSSGPFVFCQTKNNYMNQDKRIVSFTYTKEGAHAFFGAKAKLYWSNDFSFDNIYKTIEGTL